VAIKPELTPYILRTTREGRKALERLSFENSVRVEESLLRLAETAHGDVKFVGEGYAGAYRLRVAGVF
jgi:hypothetical protein